MKKQVIALLNQNDDIKELCNEIHQNKSMILEEMRFIERQFISKKEKIEKENEKIYEQIKNILIEKNFLPSGYSEQTHSIEFNLEENTIYIQNNQDDDEIILVPIPKSVFKKILPFLNK